MDIEFHLQDGCSYDYLELFFLGAAEEQLTNTRRFCGINSASMLSSALGSSVELQTQTVIAHFHSDGTYTGRGFQFSYTLQGMTYLLHHVTGMNIILAEMIDTIK